MNNLVALLLALPTTSIFAAQQTNCEELAQHVKQKMDAVRPYAFISSNNTLNLVGLRPNVRRGYHDRISPCTWIADLNYTTAENEDIDGLPQSLKEFEKYQGALMKCVKKSTSPSPLATKIIEELQQKKILIPKCITIFRQSVQAVQQQQDAYQSKQEKQQEKEKALDVFIDADDKD